MTKFRVLDPITRLIIGGAQENMMLTADFYNHPGGIELARFTHPSEPRLYIHQPFVVRLGVR